MIDLSVSAPFAFDWQPRTRLVFGAGCLSRLPEMALPLGKRALIVTDAGIVAAGYVRQAQELLDSAGLIVGVYDAVRENPTTDDVAACVDAARIIQANLLIGLGGGSSMDTAKGANFLLTNGGRMSDYQGFGKATQPMLPLIAIPTTAGTGSEVQSYALIADARTHQKMACGDSKAAPQVALLDPNLTLSLPRSVTAVTGMDALVHAVETAVTRKRNGVSLLFSQEAFRLLILNFRRVLSVPSDSAARAAMLLGASYAGLAIENSMLGAAHSMANPLTAHFGITHGQAVGMALPHVVRFNAAEPVAQTGYRDLIVAAGLAAPDISGEEAVHRLIGELESCLREAGMPRSLRECGVAREAVPTLAAEAAAQWTAQFNPRPVSAEDFANLYHHALS
ncbi:MAG: iron-containing alcohol dehydrogenase [Armatimonadaceae bacterium]